MKKESIPAVRLYQIIRDFAHANGLPFWFARDQKKAIKKYYETAARNN